MDSHTSVLPAETLDLLAPKRGEVFVDATLGLGGHASLILERISPHGRLIGCDADERNLEVAQKNLKKFPNVEFRHANFRELENFVSPNSVGGILLDLGVSSPHFDDPKRGFSFQKDGPLDLRFDQKQPLDAAEILNAWPEDEIAQVLRDFGEIGISKKIARQICERRRKQRFQTTTDLAEIIEVKKLLPQVFQALRIAVNDELSALEAALNSAPKLLKSGGRIAVIAFHSLEDRIVKNFFRKQKKSGAFEILTKKPVVPTSEEVQKNPRARSAKLRAAMKRS